ncbi:MAG TPA: PD-(D/E)XK nuclease family protein, partial [Candidatus Limnocylindrales bacterium]
FPVVFLPGLVTDRFPARARPDPLALPLELVRETLPEGDFALQEERRLFYVAMTRARDELILSHAADYGGARARRVSPFVLEALDLPVAAGTPGAGARKATAGERLATWDAISEPAEAERIAGDEALTLSFYAIDDYLTCPLKYKYAHVVRVPLAPHHSIIYGSALHQAVQEFHRRHARGDVMTEAALFEAFDRAWSNEGFLSREHEEARRESGRAALRRFREEQLRPGATIPAYVEREFSFSLGGDRIRGRWDRVDVVPVTEAESPAAPAQGDATVAMDGERVRADVVNQTLPLLGRERVTITDYKSSDVRDPVKARARARDSLQLTIYAMGWEAQTGRLPDAVQLHFLESGLVGRTPVEPERLERARTQIERAARGIRARDFSPRPDYLACTWCAYRDICPASVAGTGRAG